MRCGISSCRIGTATPSATSRRSTSTRTIWRPSRRQTPVGNAVACRVRLPGACATADDRPERQPLRGRLRCARPRRRHGRHGQDSANAWAIRSTGSSPTSRRPRLTAFFADPHRRSLATAAATRRRASSMTSSVYFRVAKSLSLRRRSRARPTSAICGRGERTEDPARASAIPTASAARSRRSCRPSRARCRKAVPISRAALDRQRLDHLQQQRQTGPPIRAVLQRLARLRVRRDRGVSPILFYDPVERVVATLHPDHTYEKVAFDPWRQTITWDVNDTVLSDPRTDPDVGDYFVRLPANDYLPTWYQERIDGQKGPRKRPPRRKPRSMPRRRPPPISTLSAGSFFPLPTTVWPTVAILTPAIMRRRSTRDIQPGRCSTSKATSAQ